MPYSSTVVLFGLILLNRPAGGMQTPATGTASADPRARALVQRALSLLQQGAPNLQRIVIEANGYEDLTAEVQGLEPDGETRRQHREILAVDRANGGVAWERHTPRTDYSLRWRRFILFPDRRGVVDLANGFGSMRPATVPESDRAGYRRRVPHFLLQEALAPSSTLRWLGRATGPGGSVDRISLSLSGGTEVTLSFDAEPQLVRVEYPLEFPGRGDTRAAIEYSGWKPHPQLGRFPAGHRVLIGNQVYQAVSYSRVRVNDETTAELLRIPPELDAVRSHSRPTAPPPMPVRPARAAGSVDSLGDGVFLVEDLGGFDLMFVDLGGEVLAVDAPAAHPFLDAIPATNYSTSPPISREYLAAIRRTLPGLPIRYLVVTHHHSDHLGGVQEFIAAGATIIAPEGDTAMVRRLAQAPHGLKSGLSRGGSPRIETVNGRRVIAGPSRSLEVYQVGANPHTHDNLLIWIAGSRTLFQGDLFYHSQGEAPPPDRAIMNRFFADWVVRQNLRPARIYGVHNDGFATAADLQP